MTGSRPAKTPEIGHVAHWHVGQLCVCLSATIVWERLTFTADVAPVKSEATCIGGSCNSDKYGFTTMDINQWISQSIS